MQEVTVDEFYSPPPTGGYITKTLCNKVTLLHLQKQCTSNSNGDALHQGVQYYIARGSDSVLSILI